MNQPAFTFPDWPFGDLKPQHYGVIMMDPPWKFSNWSKEGEDRNASEHYDCMSNEDICALPVGHLAAQDCALFCWGTSPLLPQALQAIEAWGFTFKGKAFGWSKVTKQGLENQWPIPDDRNWHMGTGYGTRSNTEDCWLATCGAPTRLDAGVRSLIVAPRREHSRKPDEAYERAERLFAGPYADIFSRQKRPGWDGFGDQLDKYNEITEQDND